MADAYLTALVWLGSRELSEHQIRARLARRGFDADDIDGAVARLRADGTISDRRVALAAARLESVVRHRGRARVLQKVRELGIDRAVADAAVDEVFADVDEAAQLERALDRRLRGKTPRELDDKARARVVRGLVGQGFALDAIMKRVRRN